MSHNNDANLLQLHQFCPVVQRHELIEQLNNFHRDINRYIHSLPAILLGVPSSNVISAAMTLNYNIECFRDAIADAIIRDGIRTDRQDLILPNTPIGRIPSPDTMRRLFDIKVPIGNIPPLIPVPSSTAPYFNPAAMQGPTYRPPQRPTRGKSQTRVSRTVDHTMFSGTISQHFEKENTAILQPSSQGSTPSIPGLFNPSFTNS